jgi:magnesium chelatase subunit D
VLPLALRHRVSSASRLPEAPPSSSPATAEATANVNVNGGDKHNGEDKRNRSVMPSGSDTGGGRAGSDRRMSSGGDKHNGEDTRNRSVMPSGSDTGGGHPGSDWRTSSDDGDRKRDAIPEGSDTGTGSDPGAGTDPGAGSGQRLSSGKAVFAPLPIVMPRIVAPGRPHAPGAAPARHAPDATAGGAARGPAIGTRQTTEPRELDARATIVHAIGQTGSPRPRADDLHEIVRKPTGGRRYLFVIDASGSQAAQQRMRLVKGAVEGLLGTSVRRGDEVAIVTFRGPAAEVVLAPTSDANVARQALHYLPTGGRTPLAHAFELAAGLVTDDTVLVLLTDGRANVALHSDDPWADALDAASRVACPALVIDSESGPDAAGRALEIATRMRAAYQPLDALDQSALINLIRR